MPEGTGFEVDPAKQQVQDRKQAERARKQMSNAEVNTNVDEHDEYTPRKKAHKMSRKQKLCRILKFHYSMIAQMKQRYAELLKNIISSQILSQFFGTATITKKYRTLNAANKSFGLARDGMKKIHNSRSCNPKVRTRNSEEEGCAQTRSRLSKILLCQRRYMSSNSGKERNCYTRKS